MKYLIAENDRVLLESLTAGLQTEWKDSVVFAAQNVHECLQLFLRECPDVILLDGDILGVDGFGLLQRIREVSDAPVVLLSARADEMSKVRGLQIGADDYLVKPFSHRELFARIRGILRRAKLTPPVSARPHFVLGDLTVNVDNHEVMVMGRPVNLTPTEYKLLYQFVDNVGRVLPFDTLLSKVWGDEYRGDMDYLKTYVSRLRKKLGDQYEHPRFIFTERTIGYRFAHGAS